MSFLKTSLIVLLLSLFLSPSVFAASIILNPIKTQISSNEEFPVDVTLSISASDGTIYYLRGVFYKSGTTSYCGYTWNGDNWFSGPYSSNNGWKNFLQITISDNSWQGQIKAKIDPENSACKDSGTYNFKVQRFTQAGSANFDAQEIKTVDVIIPTPTPTPSPTPTPTPAPTPAKITSTKSPTKTPATPAPTQKISSPIPSTGQILATATILKINVPTSVLGQSTRSAVATPSAGAIESNKEVKTLGSSQNNIFKILIVIGIAIFIFSCAILLFQHFKNKKIDNE